MKNILLAVTGLSPQVVTETLYAIHESGRDIHAIHVITTREGKDRIHAQLLSGGNGHFHKYLQEYGIDSRSIDFGPAHIHTLTGEHGAEVPDILTEADNERLLQKCLELTFRFTKDPETAVFFSVAGGRKTMSACLTLAAQLYGRPQDRLYHVLVSPFFENNREFYYPTKESRMVTYTDAQGEPSSKDTRYARVTLVNIPFVSVRSLLSPEALDSPKDPGTLMMTLIRDPSPDLVLDLGARKIHYHSVECDMPPAQLALYAFFARRKQICTKSTAFCGPCTDCYIEFTDLSLCSGEIVSLYHTIASGLPRQQLGKTGIQNLEAEQFMSLKSKIKTALRSKFGHTAQANLEIASIGQKSSTRYGIPLCKSRITLLWSGPAPPQNNAVCCKRHQPLI